MKKNILFVALLLLNWGCGSGVKKKELKSPDDEFPQLFKDVQASPLFTDSKTFADYYTNFSVEKINNAYKIEKEKKGFDLAKFIEVSFKKPAVFEIKRDSSNQKPADYLTSLLSAATRKSTDGGSIIPLRKQYVVSGEGFEEVYYDEAYFIMLGLQAAGETQLMEDMVLNFAQLIQDFGYIPHSNRTYHLSRSGQPFFAMMVSLLADIKNDRKIIVRYLPQIQREYQYWMAADTEENRAAQNEARKSGKKAYQKMVFVDKDNGINRYFDGKASPRPETYKADVVFAQKSKKTKAELYANLRTADESGWAETNRWLIGENLAAQNSAPIDLNALLYYTETLLAEAYALAEKTYYADSFKTLAAKRKAAINAYFWNETNGFYYDYNFLTKQQTPAFTLAAAYPLFCKMASEQQAEKVANVLKNKLLKSGGLAVSFPENTNQSNGILQWVAIQGLRNYGYNDLANEVKSRWLNNATKTYQQTGMFYATYDVFQPEKSTEGSQRKGFSASNGVLLRLLTEK